MKKSRSTRSPNVEERVLVECAEYLGVGPGHSTQHEDVRPLDGKQERGSNERNHEGRGAERTGGLALHDMQPDTTKEQKQGGDARG